MTKQETPKTLQEAIVFFSNPANCLNYLVARRWPNGVICPTCGRNDVTFLASQNKWQCKSAHKRRQFSIKVGTIFEDSPLGLDKWLAAVWMVTNCKNGISSYEVSRALGGKARFMHKSVRARKIQGRGAVGKVAVMGLLERHGEVRTKVIEDTKQETLLAEIDTHV